MSKVDLDAKKKNAEKDLIDNVKAAKAATLVAKGLEAGAQNAND